MKNGVRQSWPVVLVVIVAMLAWWPLTDMPGQQSVDAAFARALVAFALARGLNGVISVAQGTEFAVQPAGVGISFAPGEILDPVNDLVERFSWIMLLATSSLGIQKVLLGMSGWFGLALMLTAAGSGWLASRYLGASSTVVNLFLRGFVLLVLLRFMMPAVLLANFWVYEQFLAGDYAEASAELVKAQESIGQINAELDANRQSVPDGLVDRARELYRQAVSSIDIDQRLEQYRLAAENISENTIRLVVVFVMQTLVFPLLFLWVVAAWVRRVFRHR